MGVEIRLRCRWCGRPDVAGCDCEASQEIAHLKQQRDEAVRCSEESAEIMRRALARLTRELDEARRAAHDTAPLRARAEQAEAEVEDSEEAWRQESIRRKKAEAEVERLREQLRLANIDATTNEAEANDLRAERDRLVAKCREMGWPEDAIRAALRGEGGAVSTLDDQLRVAAAEAFAHAHPVEAAQRVVNMEGELSALRSRVEALEGALAQVAYEAHESGVKTAGEALTKIRRLTLPHWKGRARDALQPDKGDA